MYRKIESQFWTDPKVRSLDPQEKLLFLYFVTNPHAHVSGIYYLPYSTMHHETGLEPATVSRSIKTLLDRHIVFYDEIFEIIWVRRMLFYQGFSPKICRSVELHLKTLHHSNLVVSFLEEYKKQNIESPLKTIISDTVSDTISNTVSGTVSDTPLTPGVTSSSSSSKESGTGKKQLQEREKESEEKGKPRPFLSMPDFEEEDRKKIQERKALLNEQAKKLGVK